MKYTELRKINVNDHIEKKNGLSYLSWAWAVDKLLELDENASWEYGEPKEFGKTLMVFCEVTAFGKKRMAQLPVMDYRNKAIENPTAFDVNTAMQRCLAKAIALQGIGLYVYAGEDVPAEDAASVGKITPTTGVEESISEEDMGVLRAVGANIQAAYDCEQHSQAVTSWINGSRGLGVETKTFLWKQLSSKCRAYIKSQKGNNDGV